jgi:GTP-binding protein
VVNNKIDRPDRRLDEVVDEIGELFLELTEELGLDTVDDFEGNDVLDFPIVYASATGGYARLSPEDGNDNVTPLLEMMIDQIPPPHVEQDSPLQFQITTIDYNDYVGRIGIGRVTKGSIEVGDRIQLCGREESREETVTELFIFDKLGRAPVEKVTAGDICAVTGIGEVEIGDTLTDPENPDPLPLIDIDLPTISMVFQVNNSPFAGQDGKFVTSRQLRQRLYKELESNVALRVEDLPEAGSFEVSGRGTLHLGILIENMRREDYEFQVGKPRPIFIEEDGKRKEPIELLHVQTPEESAGKVIELAGSRRGEMIRYDPQGERILVQFRIPARGLIGMGSRLMSLTAGEATICHNFDGYEGHKGSIPGRAAGVMVSSEQGQAIPYALFNLKDRGPMFVSPGEPVYEGMIVGEHCKEDDITVNLCREKKLTNVRASGSDRNILLSPPRLMSIEEALEYIEEDELLEITPKTTRLRKRLLNAKLRRKDRRD